MRPLCLLVPREVTHFHLGLALQTREVCKQAFDFFTSGDELATGRGASASLLSKANMSDVLHEGSSMSSEHLPLTICISKSSLYPLRSRRTSFVPDRGAGLAYKIIESEDGDVLRHLTSCFSS